MINNKLLILGIGSIGNRYLKILKNDIRFEVKTFDKKKELKPNFSLFNEVLKWKAKSALICLPTHLHTTYIIKLILNGYKYILVEKPISHNLKNINKIKRLISKYNVKLFVVTNLRYHPGIVLLKSKINLVGKVLLAKAYFKNNPQNMYGKRLLNHYSLHHIYGGGALYDICHEIDYLKYMFGPVKKHTTVALFEKNKYATDVVYSVLTHKNNVISNISYSFLSNSKKRGCEIYGEHGTLAWTSSGKPGKERVVVKFLSKNKKEKKIFSCKNFDHNKQYAQQIKEFELMKKRKKYNMSNYQDSKNTLDIILNTKIYDF
jgi:predicted dehydrogenase